MATVAELEARREALQRAKDTGTRKVSYPDGSAVTYRDDAQMAAAIRDLERRIAAAKDGGGRGPIQVTTHKGV